MLVWQNYTKGNLGTALRCQGAKFIYIFKHPIVTPDTGETERITIHTAPVLFHRVHNLLDKIINNMFIASIMACFSAEKFTAIQYVYKRSGGWFFTRRLGCYMLLFACE